MDGVQQFVGEFASDYGPNLDYFLGRPQRSSRGISESFKVAGIKIAIFVPSAFRPFLVLQRTKWRLLKDHYRA
jgi:hypothetical protein